MSSTFYRYKRNGEVWLEPVIYNISVKNFKSLKNTGVLNLKPITLLVGPNSSGKTALLQTILLLKQTLESRNIEVPLVLRGKYVDLSSFKDIVFQHDLKEIIEILLGIRIIQHPRIRRPPDFPKLYRDISLMKFKFGYDVKSKRIINKGLEISIPEVNVSITEEKIEVIHKKEPIISYDFKKRREIEKRNFLYIPRFFPPAHFYLSRKQSLEKELKELLDKKTQLEEAIKEKPREKEKIESTIRKLERIIKGLEAELRFFEKRFGDMFKGLSIKQAEIIEFSLNVLRDSSFHLQNLLVENTYYIGPLREYPQRYYIASGEYPRDVGLRGEHTVETIYFNFKQKENRYTKLKYWMKEMGLAYDIKLSPVAEGIYALVVTDPKLGIDVNLADIGFGASQLLPIIVEGIYAESGSVLLIEQPEIHLHPRLQALLADFLIDIMMEGKQVIVETHSEHIILRLQRRIAENKLSYKDVAIYYFEPSSEGSKITHIELEEDGIIKTWPKGFFEEDLEESYFLLKALGERKNVSGS